MSNRKLLFLAPLLALGLSVSAGAAQRPEDMNWIDATLVSVDTAHRTITVRLDENEQIRSYPVADDAVIVRSEGELDRPIPLSQMHEGSEIRLEFRGLSGNDKIRKVTEHGELQR